MSKRSEMLKKYAAAIAYAGINVKDGDNIVITTDVYSLPLTREVARLCWKEGARDVLVNISDQELSLISYEEASLESLGQVADFKVAYKIAQMDNKYHRIFIGTPAPGFYKDIPQDKMQAAQRAGAKASEPLQKYMDSGEIKWTATSTASPLWAKEVFPDLAEEEAVEKLWELIFRACRIDTDDPVASWREHDSKLKQYETWLDEQNFDYLKLEGPGTDLTLHLADGHKWIGGSSETPDGVKYIANMPTEEIFTTPHKDKVNGRVRSTKPLSVMGKIIENFELEFKDGEVIAWQAEENGEMLDILFGTDEGAKRLGEVAIVPHSSPISATNVLFKSTLFDENASCHLALGQAYAEAILEGEKLSDEERAARGANKSMIHVDFMIGSDSFNVTGYKKDGRPVSILENGEWAVKL